MSSGKGRVRFALTSSVHLQGRVRDGLRSGSLALLPAIFARELPLPVLEMPRGIGLHVPAAELP
jgi:hypothetical protein